MVTDSQPFQIGVLTSQRRCGSVAVLVGCCWLVPFCRLLWVVCCGPVAISVEGRLLCVGYFASVALCRLLCVGRFVLAVVVRSP